MLKFTTSTDNLKNENPNIIEVSGLTKKFGDFVALSHRNVIAAAVKENKRVLT